jgi:hypothetical protein
MSKFMANFATYLNLFIPDHSAFSLQALCKSLSMQIVRKCGDKLSSIKRSVVECSICELEVAF